MSDKSEMVLAGFMSPNPTMAKFPHVLTTTGENTLRVIAGTIGGSVGLWGEAPMYKADGSPYLDPPDGKIVDDFALWELPSNQAYLFDRANVGPDPGFKMFISAETPAGVLKRTYEHCGGEADSCPWFGDYIQWVCDWLPELKWVLIPLEGEIPWSIFATSFDEEEMAETVKAVLRQRGIRTAQLVRRADDVAWMDHSQP